MPRFTKSITCSRSAVIFTCYFHEMTCCGSAVTTYSKPFIKPTFYIFLTFCNGAAQTSGPSTSLAWPFRHLEPTTPPKSCDGCGKKEFDNIMKPSK